MSFLFTFWLLSTLGCAAFGGASVILSMTEYRYLQHVTFFTAAILCAMSLATLVAMGLA